MSRLLRLTVALVAAGGVLGLPAVAHADPAGPTDYRTTITSIEPETAAIELDVVGGDAFLRVDVAPGHEVVVLGYAGEPYLRIRSDGTVEQNRRSYATYYNEERDGRTDIPDIVDNDADPEWERVGGGGSWAWHDHRAHWMGTERPIGLDPGDSLPPQIVPLVVDEVPVAVEVRITLAEAPSIIPVVFGLLIGLGVAALGIVLGPATTALVMLLLGSGAVVVGIGQYASLPAETGRLITWWLLPAIAVAAIVVAVATYGQSRLALMGLTAVAALQALVWAFQRRTGLSRAVLPTDLPAGFDRFVTAAVLAGSLAILVAAIRRLFETPAG